VGSFLPTCYAWLVDVSSANGRCDQPGNYLAIRLAVQWGVFDVLGDVEEKGLSSKQIAEGAGADPRLVGIYASSRTSRKDPRIISSDSMR
jgi:hypothetical protein